MITIYSSPNCAPCQDIERLIPKDRLIGEQPVEVVDIETDDGFEKFQSQLERTKQETFEIPMVFVDDQRCTLLVNGEKLNVSCP